MSRARTLWSDLSLTRKLLLGILAISLLVMGLSFAGAFGAFRDRFEAQKLADMELYARERSRTEQDLFRSLESRHLAASTIFARLHDGLVMERASPMFERIFPLQPDGTRRSIDALFEGFSDGTGAQVYGLAAFMADGAEISEAQQRTLLAATRTVFAMGQTERDLYDNFYFLTPDEHLVIYGPEREDRLMFYRRHAPADSVFFHAEYAPLLARSLERGNGLECTPLRRLASDDAGVRSRIACMTPVSVDGSVVGVWGASLHVGDYLSNAISSAPEGATGLVVSAEGDLLAWPGFLNPGLASSSEIQRYHQDMGISAVIAHIRDSGRAHGVLVSPDGANFIAYGHIPGPDWYFLVTRPRAEIATAAREAASGILFLGLLALLLQTLLVVALARRLIVKPIARIVRHGEDTVAEDGNAADIADIEGKGDEIGALARALSTERARVREGVETLEARVRERTLELERANEAKSAFLANMSHELRTPLNGVVALADLLHQRQSEPESREMAGLISSSGRLLEQVINDILDVSKIEAGQLRLESAPFDLEEAIARIAALHGAAAAAKGIRLSWSVSARARGQYLGDATRVTQVLSNLLSNAVKFTEHGSVRLSATLGQKGLRLAVRDTGIGFDAEVARRLFRRFEQADASMTRRYGGTGLGLSIVVSLVEMMGGRMDVRSTPGTGSVFAVVLPLERIEDAGHVPAPAEPHAPSRPLEGLRVLLAEDHPTNQRVVSLILQPLGVHLTMVDNGQDALDLAVRERFDLVLMDVQMPRLDGLSATRAIRAHEMAEGRARVPVISLTANALPEHVRDSLASGADLHLAKPIRPDALINAVVGVLSGIEPGTEVGAEAGVVGGAKVGEAA
ncbi:MAG: ATP-binding protein [Brevundimonas sp.]|uniref:ATP-binding protein n=1 Tax=Brevundimonas sp. TaxID=1871086 RepID=UPI00391903F8